MSDAEFAPIVMAPVAETAALGSSGLPRSVLRDLVAIRRRAVATGLLSFIGVGLYIYQWSSLEGPAARWMVMLPQLVSTVAGLITLGLCLWYARRVGALERTADVDQLAQFLAGRRRLFAGLTLLTLFSWLAIFGISVVIGVLAGLGKI
jgi:hypothetical protein